MGTCTRTPANGANRNAPVGAVAIVGRHEGGSPGISSSLGLRGVPADRLDTRPRPPRPAGGGRFPEAGHLYSRRVTRARTRGLPGPSALSPGAPALWIGQSPAIPVSPEAQNERRWPVRRRLQSDTEHSELLNAEEPRRRQPWRRPRGPALPRPSDLARASRWQDGSKTRFAPGRDHPPGVLFVRGPATGA